jgi:hypothetical protein
MTVRTTQIKLLKWRIDFMMNAPWISEKGAVNLKILRFYDECTLDIRKGGLKIMRNKKFVQHSTTFMQH